MRQHHLHPDELTDEQRSLYDVLTTGPRQQVHGSLDPAVRMADAQGRLQGPFNGFLFHPRLGMAVQEVSRILRFDGLLSGRAREIAILVVAASQRSDFEWAAHAAIARSLGLDDPEIDAIARREPLSFADADEDAVARLALALATTGDVDDTTYAETAAVLGDARVFEVATTVGMYQLIAMQLRMFRVPAPSGPWSPGD